jgi:hypothetical protein
MFLFGAPLIAVPVFFIVLLIHFANMPGNPGPAAQNAIWQGFVLGLVFGAASICTMFKGLNAIRHGIEEIRGDPVSQMLVEYHDALLSLMHDARPSPLPDIAPTPPDGQSPPDPRGG